MSHIKLKLHEYYSLDSEINGVVNNQTGETLVEGLLKEKISFVTKYWLTDLSEKVSKEKQAVEKLKEELIKKYGTEDKEGNISIPMWINEEKDEDGNIVNAEPNPTFVKFQEDFNSLLQEEKEIEYHAFKLEDFTNVTTDSNYKTFYKLIQID